MAVYESDPIIKPTDLRGILKYVPQWRNHIFVIAIDGGVVEDDNFSNLLLDVAVLRSLNIKLVLVLGIGQQLQRLAKERNVQISDVRGEGPIDDTTLRLSVEATGIVTHEVIQGLTATGLKCAVANAVRATEAGIIGGVDQRWRGKVDKVDLPFINHLIEDEIIPIIPAITHSRDGGSLRINSDTLASELAVALHASKLIYLCPFPGLTINGHYTLNITVEELRVLLEKSPTAIEERALSKARHAIKTIEGGVPRVHIMDGRLSDGLLTEIFHKVGVGSMVHGNDYQQIRQAKRKDVTAIYSITQKGVKNELLRHRTKQSIEKDIDAFFVFEIDDSIVACAALFPYADAAEIASVYVQPFYQNKGVGRKLVDYALQSATQQGFKKVFALSTQSYVFFRTVCGFTEGTMDDLPPARREMLEKSGRNSRVLLKRLQHGRTHTKANS
ncbi:MAG: amino-acid N-acetyltransferase [Verrucomicrobiota bacterium]|nr:amino-acid N-acetyltransferase [Verrucomicrobiota bacterium]